MNVHAVFLHRFYLVPIDFSLRIRNINTMNRIFSGDADAKTTVGTIIWILADISYPAPRCGKSFNYITVIKRRKQNKQCAGKQNFPRKNGLLVLAAFLFNRRFFLNGCFSFNRRFWISRNFFICGSQKCKTEKVSGYCNYSLI